MMKKETPVSLEAIHPLEKRALSLAGQARRFLLIVLAAMIMAMQDQWNNYLEPLIYINSNTKQTISVGLTFFSGMYNIQWNLVFAAAVIVALPILVVFVFLQKYFIQGVVVSGVKG